VNVSALQYKHILSIYCVYRPVSDLEICARIKTYRPGLPRQALTCDKFFKNIFIFVRRTRRRCCLLSIMLIVSYFSSITYMLLDSFTNDCSGKNGTFGTLQMLLSEEVDVIFGPICSTGIAVSTQSSLQQ